MSDHALLFIHALTGVHPGSGTALGVVDLPVQRERHTQWPTIPASAIKGVLRDQCRPEKDGSKDDWDTAFGLAGDKESFAGALSFTDARILAFPVRSLKGVFAWVTCPYVLQRLVRDWSVKNVNAANLFDLATLTEEQCLVSKSSPLLVDGKVVLEEFDFTPMENDPGVGAWVGENAFSNSNAFSSNAIKERLVIIHDNAFTHFVRFSTEVTARIGLDHEKKTVKKGALFYQEFLPAETLFYSLVSASGSRNKEKKASADEIITYLRDKVPPTIQIGGDETIGKGLCAVHFA